MGLEHYGVGMEWDWSIMELVWNGTGTLWSWYGMGLEQCGVGMEWDCWSIMESVWNGVTNCPCGMSTLNINKF